MLHAVVPLVVSRLKWTGKFVVSFLCSFCIAVFVACGDGDSGNHSGNSPGVFLVDAEMNPLDSVQQLGRTRARNTLDIRFVVIGDPHAEADYHWDIDTFQPDWPINSHYVCQRNVVRSVDRVANWFAHNPPPLMGVASVGDMIFAGQPNHSVWLYRTLWENTYSADDSAFDSRQFDRDGYSDWSYWRTTLPVFPSIGNHDDPTEDGLRENVRAYVKARVWRSDALYHPWGPTATDGDNWYDADASDIYIWEWGSFHFVSMGLWAFYDGCKGCGGNGATRTSVNWDKVKWLQTNLARVGKEKAIVLLQHFGWDYQSRTEQNKDGGILWWNDDNRDLLTDLICDREVKVGDNASCVDPYNVIAIFSGHEHKFDDASVCLTDHQPCDKSVPNYSVDDAGMCNESDKNDNGDTAGFFVVRLNGADGQMEVDQTKLSGEWRDQETKVEPWKTLPISTSFLRFDQGQPDQSSSGVDCAVIMPNGRYAATKCQHFPGYASSFLCRNPDDGTWHLSDQKSVSWADGFHMCDAAGWAFEEPKTVADQAAIIQLAQHSTFDPINPYVNYSDLGTPGVWREITPPKANFQASPVTAPAPPLSVQFTDSSSGPISSWHWDFGDGVTSTEQNPVHEYEENGMYTVTLTVTMTGPPSLISSKTAADLVKIEPYAEFTCQRTGRWCVRCGLPPIQPCPPCDYTYSYTFTNTSGGAGLTFQWDFSDGTTSTEQSPSHDFYGLSHRVVLSVRSGALSDSETKSLVECE